MNKWILFLSFLLCFACQQDQHEDSTTTSNITHEVGTSVSEDEFQEFQKDDDESCDTEEDLEKKLEKQIEQSKTEGKAMQLQGSTDPGCEI